jgi:D-threo-aldose 1-dehydrogenase
MNQAGMLSRFVAETDIDIVMVAGRYTLLDHDALPDLLPRCAAKGVAVMVVGVMNSGVLADPRSAAHFDYLPAPDPVVARVRRIAAVCERYEVPLRAAAIQFPLAHPAVTGLIAGVRTVAHLDDYPNAMRLDIPPALWDDLQREGMIPDDAPVPG